MGEKWYKVVLEKVGWEQYVKGIVCLSLWNLYLRKQKDIARFLNRGVLYAGLEFRKTLQYRYT